MVTSKLLKKVLVALFIPLVFAACGEEGGSSPNNEANAPTESEPDTTIDPAVFNCLRENDRQATLLVSILSREQIGVTLGGSGSQKTYSLTSEDDRTFYTYGSASTDHIFLVEKVMIDDTPATTGGRVFMDGAEYKCTRGESL